MFVHIAMRMPVATIECPHISWPRSSAMSFPWDSFQPPCSVQSPTSWLVRQRPSVENQLVVIRMAADPTSHFPPYISHLILSCYSLSHCPILCLYCCVTHRTSGGGRKILHIHSDCLSHCPGGCIYCLFRQCLCQSGGHGQPPRCPCIRHSNGGFQSSQARPSRSSVSQIQRVYI